MEKIDFKKAQKELYQPKAPCIVDVPAMIFFAVPGRGDPNRSPAYQEAISLLYGMSFTVKMSEKNGGAPEGYFPYVVPPLEGLWWQEGVDGIDYARKEDFQWIALLRQPDFVTEEVFAWARDTLGGKKPELDVSKVQYRRWTEGLCAQILHRGPYDDEPATILKLSEFIAQQGYAPDFSPTRFHHEIYLGDPRRTAPDRLRTVIRHPVA